VDSESSEYDSDPSGIGTMADLVLRAKDVSISPWENWRGSVGIPEVDGCRPVQSFNAPALDRDNVLALERKTLDQNTHAQEGSVSCLQELCGSDECHIACRSNCRLPWVKI
jgi:hypothetical protein